MKSKNAKIGNIILSFTTLVVTIFAIVALSYSWFQSSNSGNVSSITMEVAGVSGIELSGDAENWGNQLSQNDLNINKDIYIDSISSAGKVIDGNLQLYSINRVDNKYQTRKSSNELYIEFDFYIRNNDTVAKALTLGKNSKTIDLNDKDLSLSTRVAFINLGAATTLAGAKNLNGAGVHHVDYIWEPNSTTRTSRIGIYHNNYLKEGKMSYNGVAKEIDNATFKENLITNSGEELDVIHVDTFDPIGAGENDKITTLPQGAGAGTITKIRVYIWCEGQDLDCNNSTSGGLAQLDFNFNTYDLEEVAGNLVAKEIFDTPVLTNEENKKYEWEEVGTNLSTTTYASNYFVIINKQVNNTPTPIRTIITPNNFIDFNEVTGLDAGEYYITVIAYGKDYCKSKPSNSLLLTI